MREDLKLVVSLRYYLVKTMMLAWGFELVISAWQQDKIISSGV